MASTPAIPRSVSPHPTSANGSSPVSYDPEETGRSVRPRGHYRPGMFDGVGSSLNFAAALGVPLKAIPLIVFKDEGCKHQGCIHMAIEGNGGYCPAHSRQWYPLRHEKGGNLHGVEFTKFSNSASQGCNYNQEFGCRSSGYFPGQAAIYIPTEGHATIFATPNLFSSEQREKWRKMKEEKKKVCIFLYPWHFLPSHRRRRDDGSWELLFKRGTNQKFYDTERNKYSFPPPRYLPRQFIAEQSLSDYVRLQDRWSSETMASQMPSWMSGFLDAERARSSAPRSISPPPPPRLPTPSVRLPTTRQWKSRALALAKEKDDLIAQHADSIQRKDNVIVTLNARFEAKEKRMLDGINKLKADNLQLEDRVNELKDEIVLLTNANGKPLRYKDLYAGGILSKHVDAFTFFSSVELNDAWLELMNFTDGEGCFDEGDGLCENLRRYLKVRFDERIVW